MADKPITPSAKIVRPHSFGWLRRSDLESPGYPDIHVWEKPSGEIYNHNAKNGPLVFVSRPKQRTE